jgi:Family of unknown function (DUF6134)
MNGVREKARIQAIARTTILFLLLRGSSLLAGTSLADEVEHRDFAIVVDGKRAGSYHMEITRRDDGVSVMSGQADVRVSYLVYRYIYRYRGIEFWKDGRLQRLDSSCNDNGKSFTVNAAAGNEAVTVRVNGREHNCPAEAWTTTYWRLPDAKLRNQQITLLDSDSGRVLSATLQYVGPTELNVAGMRQTCSRYRVSGDIGADLWYDDQERLVREDTIEDGHRTVVELVRIRR